MINSCDLRIQRLFLKKLNFLKNGSKNRSRSKIKREDFLRALFFFMIGMVVYFPFSSFSQAQQKSKIKPQSSSSESKTLSKKVRPSKVLPLKNTKSQIKKETMTDDEFLDFETSSEVNFKVSKIIVKGQRKIELDAILNRFKTKVGEAFSSEKIREDVLALFKTGYFYDVKVSRDIKNEEVELTYEVLEKPSVVEIVFEGNSDVKSEDVLEASGLKTYELLNMSKIREAIEKMQKFFEEKGYFLAKIDYLVEDVKKDETVKLIFKIQENDKVRVKKISFLGNYKLKDGYLKNRLATTEGGFFSFLSGSGAYKQEAFDRDMQILRMIYYSEGYVQVKLDRPQITVTPDKKNIYITLRIDEGDQFSVGEVDFGGEILFPKEELFQIIQINKQNVFSYETLQKDIGDLQAKYGDLGYAFANVIPRTKINDKEKKVDVIFEFDKGNKVYIGQINVIGNSKTRDKVVRRELKIREGELYNETRRRESLENVQRLGFFDEVAFKTSTSPDKPDVLNLDISVKERNTGTIQFGAGYGTVTGFTLQGQVQQSNFLGKGQKLGSSLSYSQDRSEFNISFTEPYLLDSEWSLGFDLNKVDQNRSDYREKLDGGALRIGHHLSENVIGTLKYRYDVTHLEDSYVYNSTKQANVSVTDHKVYPLETASGVTSALGAIIEYDRRNDRFSPSKGLYGALSVEYAGLGGDLKYAKANASARYFQKIFWEVVWRNNFSLAAIDSMDSQRDPPFNQLFLLGGPSSLRGYRIYGVGKSVFSDLAYTQAKDRGWSDQIAKQYAIKPFGGRRQILYQMEFEFPLIQEAGIKGVTFFDIGQADDTIIDSNFYSDVGFGFRWFSPIGPLRFEWGFPIRMSEISPEPYVFEFSVGSPF